MNGDCPKYFYKYRSIDNLKNLRQDYSIQALFESYAIFSSRTNFNDLFDSKIGIVSPTPRQVKVLANKSSKAEREFLQRFVAKGKFTAEGEDRLWELTEKFDKLMDSYRFLCLSANSKSNLMWAHYAKSHQGFCIEFRSDKIRAEKVNYADEIPEIELIKILGINRPENTILGEWVWKCLKTKLKEWEYEKEYRFHADKDMMRYIVPLDRNCGKISYEPDFVESIIFGCKMSEDTKKFIRDNLPFNVKFKQAIELKSSVGIVDAT